MGTSARWASGDGKFDGVAKLVSGSFFMPPSGGSGMPLPEVSRHWVDFGFDDLWNLIAVFYNSVHF